jgi:hypothetical protein
VVPRTAVWTRAKKTHQNDSLHASSFCGFNNIARTFNVHSLKRLLSHLTIYAGAMGDGFAARKHSSQSPYVRHVARDHAGVRNRFSVMGQKKYFMSFTTQSICKVTTDESSSASYRDSHDSPSLDHLKDSS